MGLEVLGFAHSCRLSYVMLSGSALFQILEIQGDP